MRIRIAAALATTTLVLTSAMTVVHADEATDTAGKQRQVTPPKIDWQPCPEATWHNRKWRRYPHFWQCGEMEAPLDYSKPDGEKVTLRMTKYTPQHSQGTLFAVYGEVGTRQTFHSWAVNGPRRLFRTKYDVVMVDPRGVGNSEKFECAKPTKRDEDHINKFPLTESQASARILDDFAFRRECAATNPRIARFMTTADYARDLDRARQALGQDKMRMVGMMYGGLVGATYANLFPQNVGAIVADSPVDANTWTHLGGFANLNTPALARNRGVDGAQRAWEAAMAKCEELGVSRCPSAKTIREDWKYLHEEYPKRELRLGNYTRDYRTDALIEMASLSGAYGVAGRLRSIPYLARRLRAEAENERNGVEPSTEKFLPATPDDAKLLAMEEQILARSAAENPSVEALDSGDRASSGRRPVPRYPAFWVPARLMQPALGVVCSETFNPIDPTGIRLAAAQQNAIMPGQGAARVWQGSACAQWPFRGKNAYRGNYRTPGANGILILSKEFDTFGPHLEGARKMRNTLPGSKLVTVKEGYGHWALNTSHCAQRVAEHYLNTGQLPNHDVDCQAEQTLQSALARLGRWD